METKKQKRLCRPRPYHKIVGNIKELIHHRNWKDMDEQARLEDARLQFILAEGRMCYYPQRADVSDELKKLVDYIASPIYFSGELSHGKCNYLKSQLYQWTEKLPNTRDMAIRSLERLIASCERLINKMQLEQKNEFFYTMAIKRKELDSSKGIELYEQLFAEEIKTLEAEKSAATSSIFSV